MSILMKRRHTNVLSSFLVCNTNVYRAVCIDTEIEYCSVLVFLTVIKSIHQAIDASRANVREVSRSYRSGSKCMRPVDNFLWLRLSPDKKRLAGRLPLESATIVFQRFSLGRSGRRINLGEQQAWSTFTWNKWPFRLCVCMFSLWQFKCDDDSDDDDKIIITTRFTLHCV